MSERKKILDWEQYYREEPVESMPWYNPELDHDFGRTLDSLGIASGDLLDLGTGPGTQAMALALRGFSVTATDVSHAAVEKAKDRAVGSGLNITFMQDDVLGSRLTKTFDLVLDRGCFHVFHPERRAEYLRTVQRLMRPGGHLFLKCFSHKETYEDGPYRFTPEEIQEIFSPSFEIVSIEDSEFVGALDFRPKALFCVMKKSQ